VMSFGISQLVHGSQHSAVVQTYVEEIRNIFFHKALNEKILYPGETLAGFVFFDKKQIGEGETLIIPVQELNSIQKGVVSVEVRR